jgi:hypothetical protein
MKLKEWIQMDGKETWQKEWMIKIMKWNNEWKYKRMNEQKDWNEGMIEWMDERIKGRKEGRKEWMSQKNDIKEI